jgi:hypothetical protein
MKRTVEDIRRRIRHKSAALVEFMNSEIGKAVINALEEEFYEGDLFDPDPHKSAYNLGRRDVVVYLKQLQRQSERD